MTNFTQQNSFIKWEFSALSTSYSEKIAFRTEYKTLVIEQTILIIEQAIPVTEQTTPIIVQTTPKSTNVITHKIQQHFQFPSQTEI